MLSNTIYETIIENLNQNYSLIKSKNEELDKINEQIEPVKTIFNYNNDIYDTKIIVQLLNKIIEQNHNNDLVFHMIINKFFDDFIVQKINQDFYECKTGL